MTIRSAAEHALSVLETIRDYDADSGVADPDVLEAIKRLSCELGPRRAFTRPARRNRWGYTRGQLLNVIGGTLSGETVEFAGVSSALQLLVTHNGQPRHVRADCVKVAA